MITIVVMIIINRLYCAKLKLFRPVDTNSTDREVYKRDRKRSENYEFRVIILRFRGGGKKRMANVETQIDGDVRNVDRLEKTIYVYKTR